MIAQMGRLQAIPALLTPVIWGAATARWQIETVSIWRALALLFSFGALALAYNFLGAYVDYMRHIRLDGQSHAPAAGQESPRPARALLFDGFDWMRQGLLRAETFLSFGLMAGTIYVLAAIWLGFFCRLAVLVFRHDQRPDVQRFPVAGCALLPQILVGRRPCLLAGYGGHPATGNLLCPDRRHLPPGSVDRFRAGNVRMAGLPVLLLLQLASRLAAAQTHFGGRVRAGTRAGHRRHILGCWLYFFDSADGDRRGSGLDNSRSGSFPSLLTRIRPRTSLAFLQAGWHCNCGIRHQRGDIGWVALACAPVAHLIHQLENLRKDGDAGKI
jgi:hypothetical protein